jgi:adenylosuccinate lyase
MGRIWSDANKYQCWLTVEIAASQALAKFGLVPQSAADAIRDRGAFTVDRINEIEAEVRHDVIAFTTTVAEHINNPEDSRWLHYGLTSTDVVDTAQSLQLKEASAIIRAGIVSAVGTFGPPRSPNTKRPSAPNSACAPSEVATGSQRHAAYVATLAVIASTLDKIATEIRHLQRTEVREAEEFFSEKQKGSSAMPHKRNPITSEQISGLARVIRANAQVAFENIALWHERDISHSSAERVILPDSTILADYLLAKTENLIAKLLVYPARMLKNLESTGGLIFSGQLLLDLAESGMSREDAYRLVQSHAMNAWKNDLIFHDEIAKIPAITARLTPEKLARSFDYTRQPT